MNNSARFLAARNLLLEMRADYAGAYRQFSWPVLENFNWALDYFDPMATGNPATALVVASVVASESGPAVRISFAEMVSRSNRAANFLRGLGVTKGQHVLLMLGNEAPLWELMLASMKLGAVLIPCSTLLTSDDLRDRLHRGEVSHVIASASQTRVFEQVEGEYTRLAVGADIIGWRNYQEASAHSPTFTPDGQTHVTDPLLLYFTSGTTGKPKIVRHTHQSYPSGHLSTMFWLGLQPGDLHWNISSPGWAKHAYSSFFAPWNAGAAAFAHHYARFDAAAVPALLSLHGVTTLCAPPTVWRMLIQQDLAATPVPLREAASAGEPLNPEVIDRVRDAWGITVRDGYGQTETTVLVANSPGTEVKPGSMGRAMPGYRIELLDPQGNPCDEGEIAVDLATAPVGLMQGDLRRGRHEDYYRTGDIARRDSDGYIFYIGRADDVFKSSDYRISPFELESLLVEHPAVAEAAVVPSPDPLRYTVPKAFVIVAPGQTPGRELARDIFAFLRTHSAPFKRIRRLEFSDLPKTISGKIRRVELRDAELSRAMPVERKPHEFFAEDFTDITSEEVPNAKTSIPE